MAKYDVNAMARDILRIAEECGVQSNFFFLTTFKRYQTQLGMLEKLEKQIKDDGLLVTKEYVKGRQNVYVNPAVSEYNRTTDSANKTVATLMRILRNFGADAKPEEDNLMAAINGGGDPGDPDDE
ncbi:MAG: hypothetical protein IKO68_08295 [Oscillospiraceae bacterium]|nr:hypothetical protein [Oscillospiraceae bacterium]